MIKLCYKQTLSATVSRPPTSCSNANGSNLDVGVRLNGRGKSSQQLVALPLLWHIVSAINTKWEGDINAVSLPLRKHNVSAINTKWEGDIQAVASCYW